jgi:DNA-directed RNA polymerase specialized sigma subunit
MDYLREAIEHLRSYNDLNFALQNLSREINDLKATMPDVKAIEITGMPPGGGSGTADDILINKMYRLQMAEKEYKATYKAVKKIDQVLKDISKDEGEKYGQLLRMWFVQRRSKDEIADELTYSERQIYRIKDIALKKFAIQYFGIDVII